MYTSQQFFSTVFCLPTLRVGLFLFWSLALAIWFAGWVCQGRWMCAALALLTFTMARPGVVSSTPPVVPTQAVPYGFNANRLTVIIYMKQGCKAAYSSYVTSVTSGAGFNWMEKKNHVCQHSNLHEAGNLVLVLCFQSGQKHSSSHGRSARHFFILILTFQQFGVFRH